MNCPKHPQCGTWASASGERCNVCGDLVHPGGALPLLPLSEPLQVRSFATYRSLIHTDGESGKPGSEGKFPLEYQAACAQSEAGELYNLVKKVVYHGHPLTPEMRENMIEEAGDVLWHLDRAMQRIGATLDEVAAKNIVKLRTRYPNGFTTAASINRSDK